MQRLGAMLPDEALRLEIKQFTALNLNLLFATFLVVALYLGLGQLHGLPLWLADCGLLDRAASGFWFCWSCCPWP